MLIITVFSLLMVSTSSLEAQDSVSVDLTSGYNLIGLPLTPDAPLTAADLLQLINDQDGAATKVYKFTPQGWSKHDFGSGSNNFNIELGVGYFVFVSSDSAVEFTGAPIYHQDYSLVSGYNLIAAPVGINLYTAQDLLDQVADDSGEPVKLYKFTPQGWTKHDHESVSNDFAIKTIEAYFIFVNSNSDTVITAPMLEISYLAKDHAWDGFWTEWDETKVQMDGDLDLIRALGVNTVRIFIDPDEFTFPVPTQLYMDRLEEAIALIDAHGMQVHLNVVDSYWGGSFNNYDGFRTWLDNVVVPYANDPRIRIMELQNEVPLDDQIYRDWVIEIFPYFNQVAGDMPTTISVNKLDLLTDLVAITQASPPDMYGYHWYPANNMEWTSKLSSDLDTVLQIIGGDPDILLMGEYGYSSWLLSEESQADLYNDVFYHLDQKNIKNHGFWTLTDFAIGTTYEGIPFDDSQWYYGLYRTDGTAKPAAAVVQSALLTSPPQQTIGVKMYNGSFENLNVALEDVGNWRHWDQNWSAELHFFQDDSRAMDGLYSVRIDTSAGIEVGMFQTPALAVDPNKLYIIDTYTQTQNLNGWYKISLSWYDEDGVWLGEMSMSDAITDANQSTWTKVTVGPVSPPVNAGIGVVFLQAFGYDSNGSVWIDNVSLTID